METWTVENRKDRRWADCRGFTLAELLTVVVIMALVGGLGAGAFFTARRNYALHGIAGEIQGIIRAARNSALTTVSPAFVEIHPAQRVVRAYVFESVGEWSFESVEDNGGRSVSDAFHMAGEEVVKAQVVPGKVGRALDFRTTGAHVRVEANSRFDLRACVQIDAWVQHFTEREIPQLTKAVGKRRRGLRPITRRLKAADLSRVAPIVTKQGSYGLSMTSSGRLVGSIGDFDVLTMERVVPPGRWVFVSMRYDGRRVTLLADGVVRRTTDPHAASMREGVDNRPPPVAPVTSHPIFISSPDNAFPGLIDEVRLSGTVEPAEYRYSEFEHIIGWKKYIHFDRRGHLDRAHHDDAFQLTLFELADAKSRGRNTSVMVDYSKTFDEWVAQWDTPPEAITEAGEEAKIRARIQNARSVTITVERLGTISAEISGRGS